jgi:outer membrane protein TolC
VKTRRNRNGRRRWAASGALLLALGCHEGTLSHFVSVSGPAQVLDQGPDVSPPPPAPEAFPPDAAAPRLQPVDLDLVLRLAEENNPQVALARERLQAACAQRDAAGRTWLPDIYFGPAYYRHEGGIQDFNGQLIHSSTGALFGGLELHGRFDWRERAYQQLQAERGAVEKRGELSRVTNRQVLEAALTYVDLLTLRSSAAVVREFEQELPDLLEQARRRAAAAPATRVEVPRVEGELTAQRQALLNLDEKAVAAGAKMVQLLGLGQCVEVRPMDAQLVPFELVDANRPVEEFVAKALQFGPGTREVAEALALLARGEAGVGLAPWVPVLEARMAEGAFGAGPGGGLDWDNRWDLAVQARWNLTALTTVQQSRRQLDSQKRQAHLSFQDLRGQLTAGVQAAHETVRSGREQLRLGEERIRLAREALELSRTRVRSNLPGSSLGEVLLGRQAVMAAQLHYLNTVAAYDKAQLQLFLLTGLGK